MTSKKLPMLPIKENQLGKPWIMAIKYLKRLKIRASLSESEQNNLDIQRKKWYFPTIPKLKNPQKFNNYIPRLMAISKPGNKKIVIIIGKLILLISDLVRERISYQTKWSKSWILKHWRILVQKPLSYPKSKRIIEIIKMIN